MGTGLGLQWSKAKLFQSDGIDFVIGSIHFASEKIPYDDSKELTDKLIKMRGGLENFWLAYLDEMIEMVTTFGSYINVIGHLDLPKLYAKVPKELQDLKNSNSFLTRKLLTLLEIIRDHNLALDVNLAGFVKGCQVYPSMEILTHANSLGIPITFGTDTHRKEELGNNYSLGVNWALQAGYDSYISFSNCLPKRWSLKDNISNYDLNLLNLGQEILNQRFDKKDQQKTPLFSFGGKFNNLKKIFPFSNGLGTFDAIRIRKDNLSITISDTPSNQQTEGSFLYFHHTNKPGVLSLLFSILASEGINIETAFLFQHEDGTGKAYLTVDAGPEELKYATDFVLGTDPGRFLELIPNKKSTLPQTSDSRAYILEIDGIDINIPISGQMLISVHNDRPGVLFTLLAALASRNINVIDLKLGKRGNQGFAALGIEGSEGKIKEVLEIMKLGDEFTELSYIASS